jgi:hypothetical protein
MQPMMQPMMQACEHIAGAVKKSRITPDLTVKIQSRIINHGHKC